MKRECYCIQVSEHVRMNPLHSIPIAEQKSVEDFKNWRKKWQQVTADHHVIFSTLDGPYFRWRWANELKD